MNFLKEYRNCFKILIIFGYFPIGYTGSKFNNSKFSLLYTILNCILTVTVGFYGTYEIIFGDILLNNLYLNDTSRISDSINTILIFVWHFFNIILSILRKDSHARLLNQLCSIDTNLFTMISIKTYAHKPSQINNFIIFCTINLIGFLFGIFLWPVKITRSAIIFTIFHSIILVTQTFYIFYIQCLAGNLNEKFQKTADLLYIILNVENYSIENYDHSFYEIFKLLEKLLETKNEFSNAFGFHLFLNILHIFRFVTITLFTIKIMLTNYQSIPLAIYFMCIYCIPQCTKEWYLISTMDSIGRKVSQHFLYYFKT